MNEEKQTQFIEDCYEDRCEKNHDELRYDFEQDLIENDYSPAIVSECDDGREDFRRDRFCYEFFGKRSFNMTDEEIYNILKKLYKM